MSVARLCKKKRHRNIEHPEDLKLDEKREFDEGDLGLPGGLGKSYLGPTSLSCRSMFFVLHP